METQQHRNIYYHKIISINIGRELSHVMRIEQLINEGKLERPSIICLQDVPKRVNMLNIIEQILDHKYKAIVSPLLEATNYDQLYGTGVSTEHAILYLIEAVDIGFEPYIMEADKYLNSKATGIGVDLAFRSVEKRGQPNHTNDMNHQHNNNNNDREIDEWQEWIQLFSVYIKPHALDSETEGLLEWLKCKANHTGNGISRAVIVGDFNATNPHWNLVNQRSIEIDNERSEEDELSNNLELMDELEYEGILPAGDRANPNKIELTIKQYANKRDTRGRRIYHFVKRNKLHCLNQDHKQPTVNGSCVDLILVGSKLRARFNEIPMIRLATIQLKRNKHLALVSTYVMQKWWSQHESQLLDGEVPNKKRRKLYKDKRQRTNGEGSANHPGESYIDSIGGSINHDNAQSTDRPPLTRRVTRYNLNLINDEMFQSFRERADKVIKDWPRAESKRLTIILESLMELIYEQLLETQRLISSTRLVAKPKKSQARLDRNKSSRGLYVGHLYRQKMSIHNGKLLRKLNRCTVKLRRLTKEKYELKDDLMKLERHTIEQQPMRAITGTLTMTMTRLKKRLGQVEGKIWRLSRMTKRLKIRTISQANRQTMRRHLQELKTRDRRRLDNDDSLGWLEYNHDNQMTMDHNDSGPLSSRPQSPPITCDALLTSENSEQQETNYMWNRVREHNELITRIQSHDEDCRQRGNEEEDKKSNMEPIKSDYEINHIAQVNFPSNSGYSGQDIVERMITKQMDKNGGIGLEISDDEIELAIRELRAKDYTTPEGIKMKVFHHICTGHSSLSSKPSSSMINYIKLAVYLSFKLCHIPDICKATKGTLIPKKESGKFRIVHVSSPMAALMERVALHRLEFILDRHNHLDKDQYGFRAGRDRHDLVAKMMHTILMNKWSYHSNVDKGIELAKRYRITTIIGLDIQGAFDNVNHNHLLAKLDESHGLATDNIRLWLAKFIVGRKISLKYKSFKSKPRIICKGVPQGSALGPILFNFAINRIQIKHNWQHDYTKVKLLKYADDLHLIQKGYNQREMQTALDSITKQLHDIGLIINPTKCQCLPIMFGNGGYARRLEHGNYLIRNWSPLSNNDKDSEIRLESRIQVTKSLNVLGIVLTRVLRLDRKSIMDRLDLVTNKLCKIQMANIVHRAKEWHIIIDSYLTSVSIINNWPMLIVSPHDRKWLDRVLTRCLKLVFNWPVNVSIKLMRLLLNYHESDLIIEQILKLRACQRTSRDLIKDYLSLTLTLQRSIDSIDCNARRLMPEHESYDNDLNDHDPASYYADPRHMLPRETVKVQHIDEQYLNYWGPFWFTMPRKIAAMAVESHGHHITSVRLFVNNTYRIPYSNHLTLIWHLIHDRSITNRKLIFTRDDPLLLALKNFSNNRDTRLIKLRKAIREYGWEIYIMDNRHYMLIRENMQRLLELAKVRHITVVNRANIISWGQQDQMLWEQREILRTRQELNRRSRWQTNDNLNEINHIRLPTALLDINRPMTSLLIEMNAEGHGVDGNDVISYDEIESGNDDNSSRREESLRLRPYPRVFINIEEEWSNYEILCQHVNLPDLSDYLERHLARKRFEQQAKQRMEHLYMGQIPKLISSGRFQVLQQLCPSWLSGPAMMTLGGLFRDGLTQGLRKDTGDHVITCEICGNELVDPISGVRVRVIIHRATRCTGYPEQAEQFRAVVIGQYCGDIRRLTNNKKDLYKLIRLLTDCAFNRPTLMTLHSIANSPELVADESDQETIIYEQ